MSSNRCRSLAMKIRILLDFILKEVIPKTDKLFRVHVNLDLSRLCLRFYRLRGVKNRSKDFKHFIRFFANHRSRDSSFVNDRLSLKNLRNVR